MSRDCSKRGKNCPELRVSKLLSSSSYLLLLCPTMSPRCCRGKKEAIPCYQELQNILRKKLVKDKQMGTRWNQSNPRAESVTFMFCKAFCFAKLIRWFKKKKTHNKKKRKFRSEDKNKLNKFIRARVALKKIYYCQELSALLACYTWTKIQTPTWHLQSHTGTGCLYSPVLLSGKKSFRNQLSALND